MTVSEKKRKEEVEDDLKRTKEREEEARRQLRSALDRVRVAEEAEERLCRQLGEVEAEALQLARDYEALILALSDQLSQALSLLSS